MKLTETEIRQILNEVGFSPDAIELIVASSNKTALIMAVTAEVGARKAFDAILFSLNGQGSEDRKVSLGWVKTKVVKIRDYSPDLLGGLGVSVDNAKEAACKVLRTAGRPAKEQGEPLYCVKPVADRGSSQGTEVPEGNTPPQTNNLCRCGLSVCRCRPICKCGHSEYWHGSVGKRVCVSCNCQNFKEAKR